MALFTSKIPLEQTPTVTPSFIHQKPSPTYPSCPDCPRLEAELLTNKKTTADASATTKSLEEEKNLAADRLEKGEAARIKAETEVVKLRNDLREKIANFESEKNKLKSEISTKNTQLKTNRKSLDHNQSLLKHEQEISETNTQTLNNRISNLIGKNSHLQKKLEEIKEEQRREKSQMKKEGKRRKKIKDKASQTADNLSQLHNKPHNVPTKLEKVSPLLLTTAEKSPEKHCVTNIAGDMTEKVSPLILTPTEDSPEKHCVTDFASDIIDQPISDKIEKVSPLIPTPAEDSPEKHYVTNFASDIIDQLISDAQETAASSKQKVKRLSFPLYFIKQTEQLQDHNSVNEQKTKKTKRRSPNLKPIRPTNIQGRWCKLPNLNMNFRLPHNSQYCQVPWC